MHPHVSHQSRVDQIVSRHAKVKGGLIPCLHELQDEYGWLSEDLVSAAARAFNMSEGEVYSVASFYTFLTTEKKGKYVIRVCGSINCHLAEKEIILEALENELGVEVGETTPCGLFTLESTSCIGLCDQAPAMMINEERFGHLTPSKVFDIINSYRERR